MHDLSSVRVKAVPGDHIAFNVKRIAVGDLHPGFVVSDVRNDPAQESVSFIAHVSCQRTDRRMRERSARRSRSSFSISLARLVLVTLQRSTVTLHALPVLSSSCWKRSIVGQAKHSNAHPRFFGPVMLAL